VLLTASLLASSAPYNNSLAFTAEDIAEAIMMHMNSDGGFGLRRNLETTFYGAMALYYANSLSEKELREISDFVFKHYSCEEGHFTYRQGYWLSFNYYYAVQLLNLTGKLEDIPNKELLIENIKEEFLSNLKEYRSSEDSVYLRDAAELATALFILGYEFSDEEKGEILKTIGEALEQKDDIHSLYAVIVIAQALGALEKLNLSTVREKLQRLYVNNLFLESPRSDYSCVSNFKGVYIAKVLNFTISKSSIVKFIKDELRYRWTTSLREPWDMVDLYYCARTLGELEAMDAEAKEKIVSLLKPLYRNGGFNTPSSVLGTFLAVYSLKLLNKIDSLNIEKLSKLYVQDEYGLISLKDRDFDTVSTALSLGTLIAIGEEETMDVNKALKALKTLKYTPEFTEDLFFLVWGLNESNLVNNIDKNDILNQLEKFRIGKAYRYYLYEEEPSVVATLMAVLVKLMMGSYDKNDVYGLLSEVEEMIISGMYADEWGLALYLWICRALGIKPDPLIVSRLLPRGFLVLEGADLFTLTALSIIWKNSIPVSIESEIPIPVKSGRYIYGTKLTLTLGIYSEENEVIYLPQNSTTRVKFLGWYFHNGTMLSAEPEIELEVTEPLSIEARWKTQYYINVVLPDELKNLGVTVEGSGWYDEGSEAKISVSNTVVETSIARYVFTGWVDENGEILSKQPSFSFTVGKPMTIRAAWKKEYSSLVIITILGLVALIAIASILLYKRRKAKK